MGLDLHKKMVQFSVLDQLGDEIENEEIASSRQELTALIDRLLKAGPVQVALEASGCFIWAYDLLVSKLGKACVHVAAPSKVKVIAESGEKTDATDAWWLGYLLFEGRLPESFVAEGDLRELRIACREYRSVVGVRSDLIRRMRSHLLQLCRPPGKSDFKSLVGRKRIDALVAEVKASEGLRGEAIARLWQRIDEASEEVEYWSARVSELSKKFDEVKLLDEELAGVGEQIAAVVWSELGSPRRYRSAKAYAKATGLTPGYRESAGRRSGKKITREGSAHVRWALTRAVMSCTRCKKGDGLVVKAWLAKMKKRKSKKAAIVAAARKLAEAVWRLFALGEAFDLTLPFGGKRKASPAGGALRGPPERGGGGRVYVGT